MISVTTRISRAARSVIGFVTNLKQKRPMGLSFVIMFFALVVLFGVAGFLIRPPQKATFNARFAPDTKLRIRELQDRCLTGEGTDVPSFISAQVSGVVLYDPFVRPLDIVLPVENKVFEALASSLTDVPCQQCSSIEVKNSDLRLDFEQALTISVDGKGTKEYQLDRMANGDIELRMYPSSADLASKEAILQLRVTNANINVRVGTRGKDLGEFSLYPNQTMIKTIRMLPRTGLPAEGKLDLVYPGTPPDKDINLRAEICAKHMELEDTSQGVLALGPLVQKIGWGERLELNLDRFDRIVVHDDRINLNARDCENAGAPQTPWTTSEKPCIIRAVHNDVVELLPLWFTLWPDWARGLWSTFAIGTGSATFLQFLKKLNLWPTFKE